RCAGSQETGARVGARSVKSCSLYIVSQIAPGMPIPGSRFRFSNVPCDPGHRAMSRNLWIVHNARAEGASFLGQPRWKSAAKLKWSPNMASATHPARSTSQPSSELREALVRIAAPERVLTRPIELIAFASDASFYRLIPKAVVLAKGAEEVQALFRLSHERRIPLTFRAAGTSLSGQAVTEGILVEVARHWRGVKIEDGGKKVRVQPGVIGGHVNQLLRPYGVKLGPDPASINACMMGGILSNNSSGMCCGVAQNAYHTLESLKFALPSGTVIDTAEPDANEVFCAREPRLAEGILEL